MPKIELRRVRATSDGPTEYAVDVEFKVEGDLLKAGGVTNRLTNLLQAALALASE